MKTIRQILQETTEDAPIKEDDDKEYFITSIRVRDSVGKEHSIRLVRWGQTMKSPILVYIDGVIHSTKIFTNIPHAKNYGIQYVKGLK